jgi:hypothetical protein
VNLRSWWECDCVDGGESLARHRGGCGEVRDKIYDVVPQHDRSEWHEMRHFFHVNGLRVSGGAGADVSHRLSGKASLLLYNVGVNIYMLV